MHFRCMDRFNHTKNINIVQIPKLILKGLMILLKTNFILVTVLDLQKYCKDSTQSSHNPRADSLITNILTLAGFTQGNNIAILLLTKDHTILIFTKCLPNVFFLSQHTSQSTTLHLVIMSPKAPLGYDTLSYMPSNY